MIIQIALGILMETCKLYFTLFVILGMDKDNDISFSAAAILSIVTGFCILSCVKNPAYLWGYPIALTAVVVNVILLHKRNHWVFVLTSYAAICVADIIISGILISLFPAQLAGITPFSFMDLLLNLPSLILILSCAAYLEHSIDPLFKFNDYYPPIKTISIVFVAVIFLGSYLSILFSSEFKNITAGIINSKGVIVLWIIGLFFVGICISNIIHVNQNYKKAQENKAYDDMLIAQQRHYEALLNADQSIRTFRHDCINHLSCLSLLIESGQIEKAQKYIQDITGEISKKSKIMLSGNTIVDAVIQDLAQGNQDIKLEFKGTLPNDLKIRHIDLCILISNLVKCAITSVNKLEDNKFIKIVAKELNGSLHLSVQNTFPDHILISARHTKLLAARNRNIREIMEKYNGIMEHFIKKEMFCVDVVLPNIIEN